MSSEKEILKALQKKDPSISGSIRIVNGKGEGDFQVNVALTSLLITNEEVSEIIEKILGRPVMILGSVQKPSALVILEEEKETKLSSYSENKRVLDEVNVLYQGLIPVSSITPRTGEDGEPRFKKRNPEKFKNIEDCVRVLKFFSPLVLDPKLKVIDGQSRLEMAIELGFENVPVVVTDADPVRAAALSLILNRTSEFHRWIYSDVDEYVDNTPQAQPLLEPIGFFGEKLLPVSFFANTVLEYDLDEYNKQQQQYKQEMGLVEWAREQRRRIQEEEERKNSRRKPKDESDLFSLFDLKVSEDDFLETYDPKVEARHSLEEIVPQAARVTENYDAKVKAEREAAGKPWQHSKRSSKQKVKDLREEAERKALLKAAAEFDSEIVEGDENDEEIYGE